MNYSSLKASYRTFALIFTNLVALVVLLNVIVAEDYLLKNRCRAAAHRAKPRHSWQAKWKEGRSRYALSQIDMRAFEGLSSEKAEQVIDDFSALDRVGFLYEPYVEFGPTPFESKTVNVFLDESGFAYRSNDGKRHSDGPGSQSVFVFGGSTTFGWHVADDWTIPAYLEKSLREHVPVEVTNFGRGYYGWDQEMVLLQRMLSVGYRPSVALFIDGTNRPQEPYFSPQLRRAWEEAQLKSWAMPPVLLWIPMVRFIHERWQERRELEMEERLKERYGNKNAVPIGSDSYRFMLNQVRSMSSLFDIKSFFVLQPNPFYRCKHPRGRNPAAEKATANFYDSVRAINRGDFIDGSGWCEKFGEKSIAFVDNVHYSPAFNRFIAEKIASAIVPALPRKKPSALASRFVK